MSKLVLAIALAAALGASAASCKSSGSAKLEGRWRGQRADGVVPEMQPQANAFAAGTEIIAKGDQIAISTPAGKHPQSTYAVDSEDKGSVVIHTEKDGATARETFTFSDDGKTMTWRVDANRTIVFTKVDK
jgi:hypothetical protein